MMKYIRLVTGELIPAVGLGTAGLFEDKCEQAIQWALEMGYRLIDTAWAYRNQEAIGKAIRKSGVSRSEIFITSKIWRDYLNYEAALEQAQQELAGADGMATEPEGPVDDVPQPNGDPR